ncbi:MAG TPA: DUF6144 family protein [Lachnospiraceae bacterium]|nr:DUF6144 family protein [Lachnospiraceae bacterium]
MAEIVHTQAKRLYESISEIAGSEKANVILDELPLSKSPTDKKRGEWACSSCRSLCESFDSKTVESIRKNCHCKPSPQSVKQMKKLWSECGDLGEFAKKANENANGSFEMENSHNALIMKYPVCYCQFLKETDVQAPIEWCYCTLGYAEDMFSRVSGKEVTCELLESIATGGKCCRIKMNLTDRLIKQDLSNLF